MEHDKSMTSDEVTNVQRTKHMFGREPDFEGIGGPPEVAEAYVLGHLPMKCLEEYEEHLLLCGECRREVDEVTGFIEMYRLASKGIDPLPLQKALAKNT
jgi:hypothetical protein